MRVIDDCSQMTSLMLQLGTLFCYSRNLHLYHVYKIHQCTCLIFKNMGWACQLVLHLGKVLALLILNLPRNVWQFVTYKQLLHLRRSVWLQQTHQLILTISTRFYSRPMFLYYIRNINLTPWPMSIQLKYDTICCCVSVTNKYSFATFICVVHFHTCKQALIQNLDL